jgi:hypothetical protein
MSTSTLVDPLFRWLKLDETARQFRALRAFSEAAGPRIGARARAERLRGGTLYVRVSTAAWSHQLHALKSTLIEKLHATPGGEPVEDLRFSVGPLDEVPDWASPSPPSPTEATSSRTLTKPPSRPPADEIVRAMGEVVDDELREELTRLYARLGSRKRP